MRVVTGDFEWVHAGYNTEQIFVDLEKTVVDSELFFVGFAGCWFMMDVCLFQIGTSWFLVKVSFPEKWFQINLPIITIVGDLTIVDIVL